MGVATNPGAISVAELARVQTRGNARARWNKPRFLAICVAARVTALVLLLWGIAQYAGPVSGGDEQGSAAPADNADKREHEARLAAMRERAKSFEVERVAAEDRETIMLRDAPLFPTAISPAGSSTRRSGAGGPRGGPSRSPT